MNKILKEGITLIHEHTTIDLSKVKNNDDCNLNCMNETIEEFKELYKFGVRNIIDVTAKGMGRNLEYVDKVSKESNINIVCSTGYYKEHFLPQEVYENDIETLSEIMVNELLIGMENTNKKAGLIGEIGTSNNAFNEDEIKVFKASIIAQKKIGCVISTHTTLSTMAIEQANFFIENNVNPNKVIIGHQDLKGDFDQITKLIDLGFYVGFDTIGKNNYFLDEERANLIYKLQETNRIDKVCLSLDITRKSNMKYKGGIGYSYLFTDFIPLLKKHGVSDESINLMLIENPKRLFGEVL